MRWFAWSLICLLVATGCGEKTEPAVGSNSVTPDAGPNNVTADMTSDDMVVEPDTSTPDMADSDTGADAADMAVGSNDGTLPPQRPPVGVAYVGHLESTEVAWFRTDGPLLRSGGAFDVGSPVIDMVADSERELLVMAHPFERSVSIWQANQPTDANTPLVPPTELSRISFDDTVLTIAIDPYRQRLFAGESLPLPAMGPQTEQVFRIFDISDPSMPEELTAMNVPATVSWDVDPVRGIAFFAVDRTDELYGFDVGLDEITSLGDPIDLRAWYPETNSNGFVARNLTVDPWTNRLYAARPQGPLSELIIIEYPADIPNGGARYGRFAGMQDLSKLDDAFDLMLDQDQRPDLFGAYLPMRDPTLDMMFMSAEGWQGTGAAAMLVQFGAGDPTQLSPGCNDHVDGFGCFYQHVLGGAVGGYAFTDGAACLDWTHRVFVGTSIDPNDPAAPGAIHAFQYDEAGRATTFLDANDDTPLTRAYPAAAVCR